MKNKKHNWTTAFTSYSHPLKECTKCGMHKDDTFNTINGRKKVKYYTETGTLVKKAGFCNNSKI